jgi:single-stranded-DNA-specific exonuclease RecJ
MIFGNELWIWPDLDQRQVLSLARETNLPPALARILVNRGIVDPGQARAFLNPSREDLHSPWLMCGMKEAVSRIIKALELGQKIVVHGDYDADGITATVIMVEALRRLGGNVDFFLPSRFDEGYGLHCEPLRIFKDQDISLVLTVDCGINALPEIEYAVDIGLDLIITDHHQPLLELPGSVIVVNPLQKKCNYPFKELSGSGIAFKLATAIYEQQKEQFPSSLLDLAALGTAADVVPLLGENRIIVSEGLKILKEMGRVGFKALVDAVGLNRDRIDSTALAFILAPAINAAGRMGEALPAAKLLLASKPEETTELAGQLHQLNQLRRSTEQAILKEAEAAAAKLLEESGPEIITIAADNWHHGVIGIVASRLVERFNRPVALVALEGDEGRGSARSIPGFDITAALEANKQLLERFGGHEQAAGFTVKRDNIDNLREGLVHYASKHREQCLFKPQLRIETELSADEIGFDLTAGLELLKPFGQDNPVPLFGSKGWEILSWRLVGAEKKHLKLRVQKEEKLIEPIFFSGAEFEPELEKGRLINLAFRLKDGFFNNEKTLDFVLKAMQFSDIYTTGNLRLVDRRNCQDRFGYLKKVLSANLNDRERTIIFCVSRYSVKRIESSFGTFPLPKMVTGGDLDQGLKLVHGPELVIFYDLPLKAETIEPLLSGIKSSSKISFYLLFSNEDLKINRKMLDISLPSIEQVETVLTALATTVRPEESIDFNWGQLPFFNGESLPRFWNRMELIFKESDITTGKQLTEILNIPEQERLERLRLSSTFLESMILREKSEKLQNLFVSAPIEIIAGYLIDLSEENPAL